MNDLKTLDDYTKLPDGYTDYDFEQKFKESCKEALESLSNEMMKTRIKTKPQVFVVSTACNKNDFLSGFTKMQPLLTKHEDCIIVYLGTYYKPLKRRIGYDKQRRYRKIKKRY